MRVVVVGGINIDLVVGVSRLPGAGETVTGDTLIQYPGGKGANQAVALARLGADVILIGRVGRDAFGRALTRHLREEGISTRWVHGSERATGAALIAVDERGENSITVAPGANLDLLPEDVPRRPLDAADVIVAPLEVPMSSIEEAFRLGRLAGARTVLNAAPAQSVPPSLLRLTDVLIVNEHELGTLLGAPVLPGGEADAARALQRELRPAAPTIVVTMGSRGALGLAGEQLLRHPAFMVEPIDTVGAGDAFVGGFVRGRWWSGGVAGALRLGCAAGALAATTRGGQTAMPTYAAVRHLLAS
jgi:ribokinase